MAGPFDTGQEIATHLLFHIISIVIYQLIFLILPEDPTLLRILAKTIVKTAAWRLRGHPCSARPKRIKCFKKPKKKLVSNNQDIQDTTTTKKAPYVPCTGPLCHPQGGCRIEDKLRRFLCHVQRAPQFLALQGAFLDNPVV
jgi:hypothetical protein